jgi:hypothetical protein
MTIEGLCACGDEPWVVLGMLTVSRCDEDGLIVRCPDSLHCLRGAAVVDGRIGEHHRNVPGVCPWLGMRVRLHPPECGCPARITTRQLRIVLRAGCHPRGEIRSVPCPGCKCFVSTPDGVFERHGDGRCSWAGVKVVAEGFPPPLLGPE